MISNTQGKKGKVVREQTGNISFMLEKLKIIWSLFMSPFGNWNRIWNGIQSTIKYLASKSAYQPKIKLNFQVKCII